MKKWDEIKDNKFTPEKIEELDARKLKELSNLDYQFMAALNQHINECHCFLRHFTGLVSNSYITSDELKEWAEKLLQWHR